MGFKEGNKDHRSNGEEVKCTGGLKKVQGGTGSSRKVEACPQSPKDLRGLVKGPAYSEMVLLGLLLFLMKL